MKNEERVLFQVFPEYGDYLARTARLVPGVYWVTSLTRSQQSY